MVNLQKWGKKKKKSILTLATRKLPFNFHLIFFLFTLYTNLAPETRALDREPGNQVQQISMMHLMPTYWLLVYIIFVHEFALQHHQALEM